MNQDWQVWVAEQTLHGFIIILHIILILALALVGQRMIRSLLNRIVALMIKDHEIEKNKIDARVKTLQQVIGTSLGTLLWSIAGIMVLRELGIAIGPLLAGAGIASLALGFGAQTLVKDILTGLFILIENQFKIDDVIRVSGHIGKVEKMTLRTVWLRDYEGILHIIPWGALESLENLSHTWRNVILDIGIAYQSDLVHALKILSSELREMAQEPEWKTRILEPPEVMGVQSLDESSVTLRATIKTTPDDLWPVRRESLRRIKLRFDREGIEIPFPQRTVWLKNENEVSVPQAPKKIPRRRKMIPPDNPQSF